MAKFEYLARDKQGRGYRGVVEAEDANAASSKVRQQGFYLTNIKLQAKQRNVGRIRINEISVFTEQLSVMVGAGLPIIRCLRTIGQQSENKVLKKVLSELTKEIEGGNSFSSALLRYPKVFSNLYVSLVKAGETGGIIDKVLGKISEYLNKESKLRRDLIKAFSYPVIVAVVAAVVVTFLVVFIVPVFAKTYRTMGLTLPMPTQILIGLSILIRHYWWALLLTTVLIISGCKAAKKSDQGQLAIDKIKLKIPIFGELNQKVLVSRFVRTLGLLTASGINVVQALDVIRQASDSKIMTQSIDKINREVRKGAKIGDTLLKEELFPPMVVQMVAAGEESGQLSAMLNKTADFLERDADAMIGKLVVRLEPLLTFLLALAIGFIALAIYLPMFDLISNMVQK
ncbi:MAG: type II secretion system F family protein [Candidatus Omnitrophica bacterium]|nr:type II secretion system F family protein [Candidatus Omnitrophota bacterium]